MFRIINNHASLHPTGSSSSSCTREFPGLSSSWFFLRFVCMPISVRLPDVYDRPYQSVQTVSSECLRFCRARVSRFQHGLVGKKCRILKGTCLLRAEVHARVALDADAGCGVGRFMRDRADRTTRSAGTATVAACFIDHGQRF